MTDKNKRALNAGLERFPEKIIGTKKTLIEPNAPVDANVGKRLLFMTGYMHGEDDMFKRLVDWLKNNVEKYMWYDEFEGECGLTDEFYDELKKNVMGVE